MNRINNEIPKRKNLIPQMLRGGGEVFIQTVRQEFINEKRLLEFISADSLLKTDLTRGANQWENESAFTFQHLPSLSYSPLLNFVYHF
jgi:hypothetical protein